MSRMQSNLRPIDAYRLRFALEKRYNQIDRGRTLRGVEKMHITEGARLDEIERTVAEIEQAPTLDAVPVIRCRDCRHRKQLHKCPMRHIVCRDKGGHVVDLTRDEGYCDRGESRNDETA